MMTELLNPANFHYLVGLAFLITLFFILYICLRYWSKSEYPNDFEWLTPSTTKLKISDSTELYYRQAGAGRDILFIHGIGANTYCWRLLFKCFDLGKYRLTLIDLPGFGYSTKSKTLTYSLDEQSAAVHDFVRIAGLKTPHLIGSSMGGTLALWLKTTYPEHYSKVVAIAPAAGVRLIPLFFSRITNVSFLFNWTLNKKIMSLIMKRIFSKKHLVNSSTIIGYLSPYVGTKTLSIDAFVKSAHLIMDPRVPSGFSALSTPPLILTGKKDKMVKKHNVQELLKALPSYDFHLHPEGGHHLMEDEPEWVFDKISLYISKES